LRAPTLCARASPARAQPSTTRWLRTRLWCVRLCACVHASERAAQAIYAEGKTHALAVGLTKMSTHDMRSLNKGHGVETLHCLNDGLFKNYELECNV